MNYKLFILSIILLTSCNSKEQSLKERELDLKERESALREKEMIDSINEEPRVIKTVNKAQFVYDVYQNERFNFCINYPKDFLFPQPPPENGDGLQFQTKFGDGEMVASAGYAHDQTISDFYLVAVEDAKKHNHIITYQLLRDNWYVLSGTTGGKIFYHKAVLKDEVLHSLRFEYVDSQSEKFDVVIKDISIQFPNCPT